jgi:hypothetical protein
MSQADFAKKIKEFLATGPQFFADVIEAFRDQPYRDLLLAWSEIREEKILQRDGEGRSLL